MAPNETNKESFQHALLTWFDTSQRSHLPWRLTADPYAILVAEKLLQQTAARQLVIDAYETLLERYPTPEALSRAEAADILDIIRPLGFHYRAQELIQMACELIEHHNSIVPRSKIDLLKLTGVGEYCARAVLTFAFGENTAIVDTNVALFIYRLYGFSDPLPASPATNKKLIAIAEALMPSKRVRDFNLAVLDLCAAICTRRNPKCWICPVAQYCDFGQERLSTVIGH